MGRSVLDIHKYVAGALRQPTNNKNISWILLQLSLDDLDLVAAAM